MTHSIRATLLAAAAVILGAGPALAQSSVADFYKGRTITIFIGFTAGGEYDLHGRIVARFIGRHIPGNPTVIASQMTGAGTLNLANYLYNIAARDGTNLGVISNGMPAAQATGTEGIKFDAAKFYWIGALGPTIETMATWHTTGVTTLEQAMQKEVVAGSTGKGSITHVMPNVMNEMFGTKFKVVSGYRGGADVNIALERGEVGARNNSWTSWKSTKPQWLSDKLITVIAYAGPVTKELSHVPHLQTIAKSDDDRRVLNVVFAGSSLGRPIMATPGIPADRVKALRDGFDAAMADPEFVAAAQQANFDLDPIRGVDMQKVVEDVVTTPPALAARAKALME